MAVSNRQAVALRAGQSVDAAHVKLSRALATERHRNHDGSLVFRNELSRAVRELTNQLVAMYAESDAAADAASRDELIAEILERATAFVSSCIASCPPAVAPSTLLRLRENLLAPLHARVAVDFDLAVYEHARARATASATIAGMQLEFVEREGIGSWGEVWRATDLLGRTLAVKFFHHPTDSGEQELDHGRALARVDHARVQRVVAVEMQKHPELERTQLAIIAVFVQGQPLSKVARIRARDVPEMGRDIVEALAAIHDVGLVHGDLHDGNVIVGDGRATLIDVFYTHSLAAVGRASADATKDEDLRAVVEVLDAL